MDQLSIIAEETVAVNWAIIDDYAARVVKTEPSLSRAYEKVKLCRSQLLQYYQSSIVFSESIGHTMTEAINSYNESVKVYYAIELLRQLDQLD